MAEVGQEYQNVLSDYKLVTDPAEIERIRKTEPSLTVSWEVIDKEKNLFSIRVEAKDPKSSSWVEIFRQDEVGPDRDRVHDIFLKARAQVSKFYEEHGGLPAVGTINIPHAPV